MLESVSDSKPIECSNFGSYSIDDKLNLKFPKTSVALKKESADKYSYSRISENFEQKQILDMGSKIKLHICPVLPLNLPEHKTSLLYLDISTPISIGKKIKSKITLQYPIEIGVFVENNDEYELVDYFSCNPLLSRFALYGSPTGGHFCKYASVDFADDTMNNFCFAKVDVLISNNTDTSAKISKIVFDASPQDLFYSEDGVFALPLKMIIEAKDKATISYGSIAKHSCKSIRIQPKGSESFVMTEGF
jgi:hypothetical protein